MNLRPAIERKQPQRYAPLAALTLAALLPLAIAACTSEAAAPAGAPPPPEVSVAQVLTKQVAQWDDFTGRVAAMARGRSAASVSAASGA